MPLSRPIAANTFARMCMVALVLTMPARAQDDTFDEREIVRKVAMHFELETEG